MDERLMEMAPLHALGALDGDELGDFTRSLPASPELQAELAAFEAVVGRLALLHATAPSQRLRARTLGAAGFFPAAPPAPAVRRQPRRSRLRLAWAAVLAAVAFGALFGWGRAQLGEARRQAAELKQERDTLAAEITQARLQLAAVQEQLGREVAFRELVAHRESKQALLAGLAPAPAAVARVVWNPQSREAVLLAAGLAPAPEGKVYEAWVIAGGAPVPAGTFQVDADGKAVLRLPTVEETRSVKTFAVTIEPAGGTAAPTGPMVLAGAV